MNVCDVVSKNPDSNVCTLIHDDAHFMIDVIKMEIGKNVKIRYIMPFLYLLEKRRKKHRIGMQKLSC